jgi:hypothetical protein
VDALRNCNGLMVMAAMMLAVLTGRQPLVHAVSQQQVNFANDLPPALLQASPTQKTSATSCAIKRGCP